MYGSDRIHRSYAGKAPLMLAPRHDRQSSVVSFSCVNHNLHVLARPEPTQERDACNKASHNHHVLFGHPKVCRPLACEATCNAPRVSIHHPFIHILPSQLISFCLPLQLLPMVLVLLPAHVTQSCHHITPESCAWRWTALPWDLHVRASGPGLGQQVIGCPCKGKRVAN